MTTQHSGTLIYTRPTRVDLPTTYARGRCCVNSQCRTILNHFNPGPLCLLHAQQVESQMLDETLIEMEEHDARRLEKWLAA